MFCENGISLVRECQANTIAKFNYKLIDEIVNEIKLDTSKLVKISNSLELDKQDPAVELSLKILVEKIQRNKRCVLIYLNSRIDKFEQMTWEYDQMLPEQLKVNLEDNDKKFLENYNKLIKTYSQNLSLSNLDLTKDYFPPKDLYVEVRALENFSFNENGKKRLIEKNQSYLLKRRDVEYYTRMGYLVLNE